MKYSLLILLIFLGCDLNISDSNSSSNSYAINTEVVIKSNAANFPITSALVKMEWTLDYHSSNKDSAYTDSNGEVNILAQIDNVYLLNQSPQIFFYVSSSGFLNDTTIIDGNIFNASMLDTLTNKYIQNINHTIYLVPE